MPSRKARNSVNWDEFEREINPQKFNAPENSESSSSNMETSFHDCSKCRAVMNMTEEGLYVCSNRQCGIVNLSCLDFSPEWSFYNADGKNGSDPTRCGMPINPLLKESSYGGKVLVGGRSSFEMRKIARYTEWLGMPYKEKAQYDEFQTIGLLGSQGGLPKLILEDAKRYHKKISSYRTFRGLNREGIMAASVYIAARVNNYPRTPKEIATMFKLDQGSATRGCKNAVTIINNLESHMKVERKTVLAQMTASAFIDRYCSKLGIDAAHTKLCKFVARRVENNHLIPENTPNSISAGIVHFVCHCCKLSVTKSQVGAVSGISEVTINKCYKKLLALREELIPTAMDPERTNKKT